MNRTIKLEYNEIKGIFHYNEPNVNNTNSFGYKEVCNNISIETAYEFTDSVITTDKLTFDDVKNRFYKFLLTDVSI